MWHKPPPTTWGFAMCRFPESQITCNQISDYSAARNDQPVPACGLCPSGLCPSNRKQQEIYRTRKLNNENRSFRLNCSHCETCAEFLYSICRAVNLTLICCKGPDQVSAWQFHNWWTSKEPTLNRALSLELVRITFFFFSSRVFQLPIELTVITACVIRCRYTNRIHCKTVQLI